jgi:hypothetical protein
MLLCSSFNGSLNAICALINHTWVYHASPLVRRLRILVETDARTGRRDVRYGKFVKVWKLLSINSWAQKHNTTMRSLSVWKRHSISIWFYSRPLGPGCYSSILINTLSIGLLGRGISSSQGRHLHTGQHKHRKNAHRHPCLEWDWNPRSELSSGWRRFIPC